jgi:hypothetical protein
MSMPSGRLAGGCQCGALRYEITAAPRETYVCHCTECRAQSSSAFGISVIVERAGFRLTAGEPRRWSRPTAGGGRLDCYFCTDCGSRIWHQGVDPEGREQTLISVKGGSFDRPVDVTDAAHIWTASRLPGILIPNHAPQFPGEPD